MNIAIINIQSVHATSFGGGAIGYILEGRVAAFDGSSSNDFALTVNIPAGSSRNAFNEAILQTGIDVLATHDIAVDARDVFFQTFDRG